MVLSDLPLGMWKWDIVCHPKFAVRVKEWRTWCCVQSVRYEAEREIVSQPRLYLSTVIMWKMNQCAGWCGREWRGGLLHLMAIVWPSAVVPTAVSSLLDLSPLTRLLSLVAVSWLSFLCPLLPLLLSLCFAHFWLVAFCFSCNPSQTVLPAMIKACQIFCFVTVVL